MNNIYVINARGVEFTVEEAQAFYAGKGYHGEHGCHVCPANQGFKQGAAYICGPCGQQNCWVNDEEE